ncbi:MAG: hypothetical protein BRD55_00910 [Bacteroidetes bacterium SW_9_63_38]|nr:MAG: hypothetical protein BRD55_00910 [Bacteroidetes bacterium SW_9_63_38]
MAAVRRVGVVHAPFEDVGVGARVGAGGVGGIEVQQVAELGEEELLVAVLGGAGRGPALDEGVDGHGQRQK